MQRMIAFVWSIAIATSMYAGTPLGTAFTYQGRLKDGGSSANGTYDVRFALYDQLIDGTQQGPTVCADNVTVAEGLFTLELDFGVQFTGQERFLEIAVRTDTGSNCGNSTGFVTLDPRQTLTGTPHALYALNADTLDGLDSTAFLQSILAPLTLSGSNPSAHIISGENITTTNNSYGVQGLCTGGSGVTHGVYGRTDSTSGRGVYGEASAGSGFAHGVYGLSNSTSGYGVYGRATAGIGSTNGGFFQCDSTSGSGVTAIATAGTGFTYGAYGGSDSVSGRGVVGKATARTGTTYGGYFESDSTDGYAVYGKATAETGYNNGVFGGSGSPLGRGVVGLAYADTGIAEAVYGQCNSTSGRGVFGWATAATGTNYGVYGQSSSASGSGVHGEATAGTGTTYGGHFVSNSTDGYGVYGETTAASGVTYGVFGESQSTGGIGVFGTAKASTGFNYGVFARSDSTNGRGIYAWANADSGNPVAVYGDCDSPEGFSCYFAGPVGSRNYFQRNVGIGTIAPNVALHVATGSDASLSSGSGYVVLGDVSGSNLVIDNNEIIARDNGAGAKLYLNHEGGNVGILRNSASHPLHVGNDNANGNGAHLTAGGTWTNGSSRDFKGGFEPIDKQAVLRKVVELPVTRWRYKGEAVNVHHIGPVAEDFRAAFEVGHDERYITTVDADGVALAAIQGLYGIVQEKNREIDELKAKVESVDRLEAKVAALEGLVSKLAAQNGSGR